MSDLKPSPPLQSDGKGEQNTTDTETTFPKSSEGGINNTITSTSTYTDSKTEVRGDTHRLNSPHNETRNENPTKPKSPIINEREQIERVSHHSENTERNNETETDIGHQEMKQTKPKNWTDDETVSTHKSQNKDDEENIHGNETSRSKGTKTASSTPRKENNGNGNDVLHSKTSKLKPEGDKEKKDVNPQKKEETNEGTPMQSKASDKFIDGKHPKGNNSNERNSNHTKHNDKEKDSDSGAGKHNDCDTYDKFSDSDTTGGKSSLSNYTIPKRKAQKKPQNSSTSPRSTKSNNSILKTDVTSKEKPLSFMASLVNDGTIYRQPTTRGSGERNVVTLPALNSHYEINKVYVDDTEKLVNKYPKRDKDFKLEFVYDLKPKYPSWYSPQKKMSRRERKIHSEISGIYADYQKQDERCLANIKKMEERRKQIEKIKEQERKEKRSKKLEDTLTQYGQLKEVREKFEILTWYRNQTQYITPRVLEHEKLSRHEYGLPESLNEYEKQIKNLRRKNKKRHKTANMRIKSQ